MGRASGEPGENQGRARGRTRGEPEGKPGKSKVKSQMKANCWGIDRGQRERAGGEMGEELWESLFPLVM